MAEKVNRPPSTSAIGGAPLAVDRQAPRTTAPHGMTGPEITRLKNAVWFMAQSGCSLWWVTTAKGTLRSGIAEVWKRITRLQAAHQLPPYSVLVFETRGGLHAHCIFGGNAEIAYRLKGAAFGATIRVDQVTDARKLARKYLSKERTPQAGFKRSHVLGGRLKGSHPLSGGGDRVRLSRQLERDAVGGGVIEPWQHSNAKRSTTKRKPYRPRKLAKRKSLVPVGQLSLFPKTEPLRLRDFAHGLMSPAVLREAKFRLQQSGLTQAELGRRIGTHQPHVSNVLRGHDPLSEFAANRLRDALLGGSSK